MSEPRNSRWWEYYAVRYFVGTVFGAGIVVFLTEYQSSPLKGFLSKIVAVNGTEFKDITVFASIGFAYCYVASSPILTLHTLREYIHLSHLREHVWRWPVALALGAATTWAVATYWLSCLYLVGYLVASLLVFIIGLQLVLAATAVFNRFAIVRAFYEGLSAARASKARRATEYVESYRHLREHGNAFSILLMEAILGFILANMPTANAAMLVLVVWVVPACTSWLVGTALESTFAHDAPLPEDGEPLRQPDG